MRRRLRDDWSFLPWAATRKKLRFAKEMRRNPTAAEARLWSRLRYRQLRGLKFRRQHIIAGFIVDFYCPMLQLAVEVDGPHHQLQQSDDRFRTDVLRTYGVRVVRVSADAVMDDTEQVLQYLLDVVCGKVLPPQPD